MSVFCVPDLGEGLGEVQIVAWHVGAGDHVATDQPLVSVETDKALVEIPAPGPGTVARTYGEPGDVVAVGAPLVEFDGGAPDSRTTDSGTVVGSLPDAPGPPRGAPPRHRPTPPEGATVSPPSFAASPAVRRRAAELGVDLASVRGTGPEGAPTRADVEAAATPPPTGSGVSAPTPAPTPLRGVRRSMAANMTRAGAVVVPATVTDDADVHDWRPDEDVTVRLVQAVVHACAAEPALNAWYQGPDNGIVLWPVLHLGIAVDTEDGLFVPVLHEAGNRTSADLRVELSAMADAVRRRQVRPADLRGATFTLSNFGTLAGRYGALVIVPPQVGILGAGRVREAVVARDGIPVVRRVLPLSLTFDHRVVTGGEASRFLAAAITALQQPRSLDQSE